MRAHPRTTRRADPAGPEILAQPGDDGRSADRRGVALSQRPRGSRRIAAQAAIDLLQQVRIRDPGRVAALYPHELSGGMGQRVMIAMMLAPDPELLIADEPTSALDATVQAEILRLIEDLVSRRGMGLILISHDLPLVSHFCDRVMVMYAGRVLERLPAGAARPRPASIHARAARLPALADAAAAATGDAGARSGMAHVMTSPMIEVEQLHVRFGETEAVKGVSFSVPQGDSFGIVGESGSGKSTVLRALSGLNPNWTGRIVDRRRWCSARSATSGSFAVCRWCSRTHTDRCIRVRQWTAPSPNHCWCTAIGDVESRILRGSPRWRCRTPCASAIRTSSPAGSASAWRSRAR